VLDSPRLPAGLGGRECRIRRTIAQLTAALLLAATSGSTLGDELTEAAKRLLGERRAKEAYQLLLPQESARAGDIEFDYLLGIAANDAGEHERAVFALERVLALQPANHLARAEIARAYLALGEREAARREFETVRGQSIPAEAKATIERFLAAIRAAETTRVDGFIELAFGYDSNVNSATASSQVAIPALGGIVATLDPAATRRGDAFGALAGGISLTHNLTPAWALVGNASALARLHADESQFDQLTFDASLGARWSHGRDAVTLGAQLQSFELDYARYREVKGLVAQWQRSYDEQHQVSLFGQYSQLRYPTQSIRDADREVLGAAYGRAFAVRYTPVVFGSAYVGRERELASGVPHLGHELWGIRLGGQLTLGRGWALVGSVAYEERRYGGPEPLFLDTRKDRQADLSAGVSYLLRANTTLLALLARTDNHSNIPINQFDRTVATVSLRFTF
jgi:outer membrane protein